MLFAQLVLRYQSSELKVHKKIVFSNNVCLLSFIVRRIVKL